MSSTFSNLKFELIGTGEQSGLWGSTTNTNIGTAIEQAIVGMATLTSANFTANVATLILANTNAPQDARALCLVIAAGAVSAVGTLNVPNIEKPYLVINNSSYAVTVKVTGLTGVSVPAGKRTVVYNNGTDIGNQIDYLSTLALGTALPITSGGTGAITAASARTNLGLVIGTDVPSPTGTGSSGTWPISINGNAANATIAAAALTANNVTGIVAVANGGTGASTAATARTNLGLVIGTNVPSPTGAGASGTWGISISGNAATATSATTATTATNATNAANLITANWTVNESGGYLYFKYGGVNKMRLDSSGSLVVVGNITAYGSI